MLTVPPIEQDRYYSLQFVDGYTYNFAYVGSRTTGNGGGKYLLAGPNWKGDKPEGVDEVIRSDTDLAFVLYRTQLFGPVDIDNVKKIQAGYQVAPLSVFLNQPPPAPAPADRLRATADTPSSSAPRRSSSRSSTSCCSSPRRCPPRRSCATGSPASASAATGGFDADALSPEMRTAIEAGIADAWAEFDTFKKDKIDTGKVTLRRSSSAPATTSRATTCTGWPARCSASTATPPPKLFTRASPIDAAGAPLTGANNYTYRFPPGQLPPVNAFWSLTMYEMPAQPAGRQPDQPLPDQFADAARPGEGPRRRIHASTSRTVSPGVDKEANWLPAPNGPFVLVLRLYWPKPDALNGTWKSPQPVKA